MNYKQLKEDILIARLSECGLTVDSLIKNLQSGDELSKSIVIYISQFEGLGSSRSDFDVYIERGISVSETDVIAKTDKLKRLGEGVFDIEYVDRHSISEDISVIMKVINTSVQYSGSLKRLKKIKEGVLIYGESSIRELIDSVDVDSYILEDYLMLANAEYDDALQMYRSGYFYSALNTGRRALEFAAGAYNAVSGKCNLKYKWIPVIFERQSCLEDLDLFEQYKKYMVYGIVGKDNLALFISDMLDFISVLISNISFKR